MKSPLFFGLLAFTASISLTEPAFARPAGGKTDGGTIDDAGFAPDATTATARPVNAPDRRPLNDLSEKRFELHPPIELLDRRGSNVIRSGEPVSTLATCGTCHDTHYISANNAHAWAGTRQRVTPGKAPSGRPWDTGTGLYGRWDPLVYRVLTPAGAPYSDLTQEDWSRVYGAWHTGGGPAYAGQAEGSQVEPNCFICHLRQPDNRARIESLCQGRFAWAATAALSRTAVVDPCDTEPFCYRENEFDELGRVTAQSLGLQHPDSASCGQCHGRVHLDREPLVLRYDENDRRSLATGQVFSPQQMSRSGVNLQGREELRRSWDVHAERLLSCSNCHPSINNPAYYAESTLSRPRHQKFEARKLAVHEYLVRPNHFFAKGHSTQQTADDHLDGSMRGCRDCHDYTKGHDFLPNPEQHVRRLGCETCHVPHVYGPGLQEVDWTAITPAGEPRRIYRGIRGRLNDAGALVTGYQPVLLPRREPDGETRLLPHNLVTVTYWRSREQKRPVYLSELRRVFARPGPELQKALDRDGNGSIDQDELVLDTEARVEAVRAQLRRSGIPDPEIAAEIQPHGIHHSVAPSGWAVKRCGECHADDSRLSRPFPISDRVPDGAVPALVGDSSAVLSGDITREKDGALIFRPRPVLAGVYLVGHDRLPLVDALGLLSLLLVLLGMGGHAGLRLCAWARRRKESE
mgnify:CR=1 FL=1